MIALFTLSCASRLPTIANNSDCALQLANEALHDLMHNVHLHQYNFQNSYLHQKVDYKLQVKHYASYYKSQERKKWWLT